MTIHITSSANRWECASGSSYSYQILQTVIDGQQIELSSIAGGVLALGDYPARVSAKITSPKGWSAYDTVKGYDFLMLDGKIRTFNIIGISTIGTPAPAAANP